MDKKVLIINGPNLNMLGKRETGIYGNVSFDDFLKKAKKKFEKYFKIDYFQSNSESKIIEKIQSSDNLYLAIILNAAAYTHTSIAIADAVALIKTKVIEVHISNIFAREKFRHKSLIAPYCIGQIIGFGLDSYLLALEWIKNNC